MLQRQAKIPLYTQFSYTHALCFFGMHTLILINILSKIAVIWKDWQNPEWIMRQSRITHSFRTVVANLSELMDHWDKNWNWHRQHATRASNQSFTKGYNVSFGSLSKEEGRRWNTVGEDGTGWAEQGWEGEETGQVNCNKRKSLVPGLLCFQMWSLSLPAYTVPAAR